MYYTEPRGWGLRGGFALDANVNAAMWTTIQLNFKHRVSLLHLLQQAIANPEQELQRSRGVRVNYWSVQQLNGLPG